VLNYLIKGNIRFTKEILWLSALDSLFYGGISVEIYPICITEVVNPGKMVFSFIFERNFLDLELRLSSYADP
jgi:hypothetical protein